MIAQPVLRSWPWLPLSRVQLILRQDRNSMLAVRAPRVWSLLFLEVLAARAKCVTSARNSIGHRWGYARIYGGKNGHTCAYLWAMYAHIYGSSNGHECAYLWAMYARIYGSSNGHECAYLWGQEWPCIRVYL